MISRIVSRLRDPEFAAGLGAVVLVNAFLIAVFYNKGWIPNDDGHYAYVANRLTNGDILNRDIEELHPGYVHFIHAWSFKVFGTSLVSLRYPLMLLVALQSVLTYVIFRRTGMIVAATAAMVMSAVGPLQIANPTTSLYALACTVALAGLLMNTTPQTRFRALWIGVLLGLVFLFRQLTAVFIVSGTLAFVTTERRAHAAHGKDLLLARVLLVLATLGTTGYVLTSGSPTVWVLFGIMPILVLAWSIKHATIGNVELFTTGLKIGLGSFLASLPLLTYHLANGSTGVWLNDTFVRSTSINGLDGLGTSIFLPKYIVPALVNLITGSFSRKLNAIYWLALLAAAVLLGVGLLRRMHHQQSEASPERDGGGRGLDRAFALPILALFNAQVSIFIEVGYYLYLGASLSIIGGLWMRSRLHLRPTEDSTSLAFVDGARPRLNLTVALFVIFIGISFHAGQPFTRSHAAAVSGVRFDLVESQVPNLGLWIAENEEARYLAVLNELDQRREPGDMLMTLPNTAEVSFLSGLDNDFRIFNATISLLNQEEIDEFVVEFNEAQPRFIVHDTVSEYNIPRTLGLLDRISTGYEVVFTFERFDLYERQSG